MTPSGLKKKAQRLFERYLASIIEARADEFFPVDVPFTKLSAQQDYDELRQTADALLACQKRPTKPGPSIELTTVRTRTFGDQSLPTRITFATPADLAGFLNRDKELSLFRSNLEATDKLLPKLLEQAPAKRLVRMMLAHADTWRGLIEVCHYFVQNPRPELFLRELPLAVDTKFIESNLQSLRILLLDVLPEAAVDRNGKTFAETFGLKRYPTLIRFRCLDRGLRDRLGLPFIEMAATLEDLATLAVPSDVTVFVVENLTSFATLPDCPNALAVFGQGASSILLGRLPWLAACRILYWGDLDAQGFEMLSTFRQAHPHTESILMDRSTYNAHAAYHVEGTPTKIKDTPGLLPDERSLYEHLAQSTGRLEQERISDANISQLVSGTVCNPLKEQCR